MRTSIPIVSVLVSLIATGAASAQAPAARSAAFIVSVDSEGLYSDSAEGASQRLDDSALVQRAAAVLSDDSSATFAIEADAAAPYERVTRAAQLLQQAGVTKIGFRTRRSVER